MDRSWDYWLMAWNFEPSVWVGIVVLYGSYLFAAGPLRTRFANSRPIAMRQLVYWTFGNLTLFFALITPLDLISDRYLFSAHMTQHIFLSLVAPPLLLLGLPGWLFDPLERYPRTLAAARWLCRPFIAFTLFNVIFAVWHAPFFYNLALYSEPIHLFEHAMIFASALLTWMPVLSPTPLLPRLPLPTQVLYLFMESIPATGLGAIITLAPQPLYSFYANAPRAFGISVLEDQVWAGLVMWVGGAMIFLLALTLVFAKWFSPGERREGKGFV